MDTRGWIWRRCRRGCLAENKLLHHLFVLGGKAADGATAAVESFSLVDGAWTTRASLPVALHGAVAARLGERLVVTGGVVEGRVSARGWRMPFPFGAR